MRLVRIAALGVLFGAGCTDSCSFEQVLQERAGGGAVACEGTSPSLERRVDGDSIELATQDSCALERYEANEPFTLQAQLDREAGQDAGDVVGLALGRERGLHALVGEVQGGTFTVSTWACAEAVMAEGALTCRFPRATPSAAARPATESSATA